MSERFWNWADEHPFGAVVVGAVVGGVMAVLLFLVLVL